MELLGTDCKAVRKRRSTSWYRGAEPPMNSSARNCLDLAVATSGGIAADGVDVAKR